MRVRVSFDGNFRAKLWEAWNGQPQSILHALMALADIAFADHRDIALVLGKDVDGTDPLQRFAGAGILRMEGGAEAGKKEQNGQARVHAKGFLIVWARQP